MGAAGAVGDAVVKRLNWRLTTLFNPDVTDVGLSVPQGVLSKQLFDHVYRWLVVRDAGAVGGTGGAALAYPKP